MKITTILSAAVLSACTFLTAAQPIAEYSFDGNAGKGQAAGKFRYEAGVRGQAIVLSDGTVTVPAPAALPMDEGSITFWFKPVNWDTDSAEFVNLISSSNKEGNGRLMLYKYSKAGGLGILFWFGNPNVRAESVYATDNCKARLTKGAWTFCTMTWSRKDHLLLLFFNADLTASNSLSDNKFFKSFGPFILNSYPFNPSNRANKTAFDGLKFYSKALTRYEIKNLFAAESKNLKSK